MMQEMNLKELAGMGRSSGKTRTIERMVLQEVKRMEEANRDQFELLNLKRFVENHPLTFKDMAKIQSMGAVIGDDPRFRATLNDSNVIYSVEDHPQKTGDSVRFRHVSIVQRGQHRPQDAVVNGILIHLGFHVTVDSEKGHVGYNGSFRVDVDDHDGAMDVMEIFDLGG